MRKKCNQNYLILKKGVSLSYTSLMSKEDIAIIKNKKNIYKKNLKQKFFVCVF